MDQIFLEPKTGDVDLFYLFFSVNISSIIYENHDLIKYFYRLLIMLDVVNNSILRGQECIQ